MHILISFVANHAEFFGTRPVGRERTSIREADTSRKSLYWKQLPQEGRKSTHVADLSASF